MLQSGWDRARASLRRSLRADRDREKTHVRPGEDWAVGIPAARGRRSGPRRSSRRGAESFADLPMSPVVNADRLPAEDRTADPAARRRRSASRRSSRAPREEVHAEEDDDDDLNWGADSDTSGDEDYAPDFSGFTMRLPENDFCAPVAPASPDHSPARRSKRRSIRPPPVAAAAQPLRSSSTSSTSPKRLSSSRLSTSRKLLSSIMYPATANE